MFFFDPDKIVMFRRLHFGRLRHTSPTHAPYRGPSLDLPVGPGFPVARWFDCLMVVVQ